MTGLDAGSAVADAAPRLLAIDCSSDQAGLALFDGTSISELSWPAARSQTTSVLAAIQQLLSLNALEISEIAAVGVAIGPGPFSGLRVGLSIAKGLVLGLGLPIIGVPTLAVAALPYAGLGPTVVPLVPAGRGRVVWAAYGGAGDTWAELLPVRNSTVRELIDALPSTGPVLVTGELSEDQAPLLLALDHVTLAAPALRTRRPAAVAALAWTRFQQGDVDDPGTLQAIYAGRDQS